MFIVELWDVLVGWVANWENGWLRYHTDLNVSAVLSFNATKKVKTFTNTMTHYVKMHVAGAASTEMCEEILSCLILTQKHKNKLENK